MSKPPEITLVYPVPTEDSPVKGPAMSIFYPGASLENAGFTVAYYDERFDPQKKLKCLIKETSLFIGISSLTGYQLKGALKILREIKSLRPDLPAVIGGVHPSLLPEECLREGLADIIVIGEGEETVVELAKSISLKNRLNHVKGLAFKQDNRTVFTDQRPFLSGDRWPFPMTENNICYFEQAARFQEILYFTSRGCPHRCRFCYNQVFNRGKWRPMPVEKFASEIGEFVKRLRFSHIYINDDNLGGNAERLSDIGAVLKRYELRWSTCMRAPDINRGTISILEKSGCRRIFIGVETGSERILRKIIGKGYGEGIDDIVNCAKLIAGTDIRPTYSFMSNIPTETGEEREMSMALADRLRRIDPKSSISFYVYAPYPGTPLFDQIKQDGFIPPEGMEEWSKISLSNPINPLSENLFYISGLRFRGGRGDTTSKNFPGLRRAIILPFEISARFRWKKRFLRWYNIEKYIIKILFRRASRRRSLSGRIAQLV